MFEAAHKHSSLTVEWMDFREVCGASSVRFFPCQYIKGVLQFSLKIGSSIFKERQQSWSGIKWQSGNESEWEA